MSKRQDAEKAERIPWRERARGHLRSLTLTLQEQALVAAILLSIVLGSAIQYWRREYRLSHPAAAAPAPVTGERTAAGSP
jgi:hypothetical protein